jgi:hypothetical protein
MQIRQLELRADRQLLDHELEVVVAGKRHDIAIRISHAHTQRRRNGPAQRTGLTAIDPVARLEYMQELPARDLRQSDCADIAGVPAERCVHLLIDALRLDRLVFKVRLAQHRLLAFPAFRDPRRAVRQTRLTLLCDLNEELKRRLRVRYDAIVGGEHTTDLGRLDVYMHELPALRVDIDRPGVSVSPTVADPQHEVRGEHRGVAIAMAGLQPNHASHQTMIVRNCSPTHQRRNDRHACQLSKLNQKV